MTLLVHIPKKDFNGYKITKNLFCKKKTKV